MPLFPKKAMVGVDLGHSTIKVVQLERSSGGYKVVRVATCATPKDAIKDGVVVDAGGAGEAIKNLMKENHIHANTASIAVSGGSVVVRNVKIPKMPEATLRKSIKFEGSRYVPTNVDDSYIEFEIIGPADDNQLEILVVAAPREIVDSRVQACKKAGLEVESVDIEAFAGYRSLVEADQLNEYSDQTIALVDIGSNTTIVSVVRKGPFVMSRSISNGGNVLTDALKSYFKLTDEEAEQGKAALDVTELIDEKSPKENPPLRVIQPHLDDLVREVRRSLNYFQSQQGEATEDRNVTTLILSGGGAKLGGLAPYMSHKLGINTFAIGTYDNPRFAHTLENDVHGFDFAVATGLAMRAFAKAA